MNAIKLSPRAKRVLRSALALAITAGIVAALIKASSDAGSVSWPSPQEIAFSFVLIAATLLFAAASWAVLLAGHGARFMLGGGFLVAQLGKYVPGGVVQLAQLYESARRAGVERRVVAVAMPVHALCGTVAPGALAAVVLAIVGSHLNPAIRLVLGLLGLFSLVISVARRGISFLLDRLHARWARVPSGDAVPSQLAILRSFSLSLGTGCCFGAAYAVLLGADGFQNQVLAGLGFLVAFAVGFLALPFPSGLGVREATLVALLAEVAPVADILAAAIAVRILQIVVEIPLAGAVSAAPVLSRLRTGTTSPEPSDIHVVGEAADGVKTE